MGVVQWESLGMFRMGFVFTVHWVCSGENQWVWSSGCSPVGVSQDESVEHKGSQRCGLEGNSGCGFVGDQWVWSGGKQCVF